MIDIDGRLLGLAKFTAAWTAVWSLILLSVPAGASGRNHIVSLNAAHGLVCTVLAVSTICFEWDSTNSVSVSLAFFLVDLAAMVNADGISKLLMVNRSRQMDYVHHVLGIFWGTLLFAHEASVCVSGLGNAYVWIQTNEISTPFYNWFRLTNSKLAGLLFVAFFFLSRVLFNSVYLIPRVWFECDRRYLFGCAPYFALQYVWFVMIVKKMLRSAAAPPRKVD